MYERYLWPFNHVVFSQADHSKTLFSNIFYVLWLKSHILWPVKHNHLTEYILVLIYCYSCDNNRLGTFRMIFFYASKFYYPNHVFDNISRITIHKCLINLNMYKDNKNDKTMSYNVYIKYNLDTMYLGLGLILTEWIAHECPAITSQSLALPATIETVISHHHHLKVKFIQSNKTSWSHKLFTNQDKNRENKSPH